MNREVEIFWLYKIRSVALFSYRDIKLGFSSYFLVVCADLHHLVYFMKWKCFWFCFLLSGNFHSVVRLKNHKLRNLKRSVEMFQPNLMDGAGQLHPLDMTQNTSESDLARLRDDDFDSKSGSENHEGASGDDQDPNQRPKKKRYHRHTQHQIQEMEA